MLSRKISFEDKVLAQFERQNELLSAILKAQLATVIDKELSDKKLEKLYQLTGKFKIKEIAKKLSMGDKTITSIWQRWEMLGLIIKDGNVYRKVT